MSKRRPKKKRGKMPPQSIVMNYEVTMSPKLLPLSRFNLDPAGSIQFAPVVKSAATTAGGVVSCRIGAGGDACLQYDYMGRTTRIRLSPEALELSWRLFNELKSGPQQDQNTGSVHRWKIVGPPK